MLQLNIESGLQQEAESVLQELGISADIAVTMLYEYVREERRLPTGLRVPNKLTRETIEKSERGEDIIVCSSFEEMYESLGM
jgi:DNA-damage-inducible protein J